MTVPLLSNTALEVSTDLAADLMTEIQGLVNQLWDINYNIPGGGGSLTGSPNDLKYNYAQTYQGSATIVPGAPAYTITPAYTVPAVMSPAVPGWGTTNSCGWYGKHCTTEIPGTPAYTITPSYVVPAVMSPAIPATTGGYSTTLNVSATAQGISDALTPLFSSVTFTSGAMGAPNADFQATETVTYNLDQIIEGSAVRISGTAAFDNLSVSLAGVTTNFGNVSTGSMSLSPVPNIPISFDAIIKIPSYNSEIGNFNSSDDVFYWLFPQTDSVSVSNMSISTGVNAIADFINNDLLQYLTDFWNVSVVPLFTGVGATAPQAPSQTLANTISKEATTAQNEVNSQAESGLNSLLKEELNTIKPYVQAITAATWNYSSYPIIPGGYYEGAILTSGLFSGVNASNSNFSNANLGGANFSYANLTGSNFSGAILSGTNFTGATGAPTTSALSSSLSASSALLTPTEATGTSSLEAIGADNNAALDVASFSNAVVFGTDFTGSNLNPKGAFYDENTLFAAGYDPNANGLQYWSAPQFVAGNQDLIQAFGANVDTATAYFINNVAACGCAGKVGIRSDVVNGILPLDSFDETAYFRRLPRPTQSKFNTLFSSNPQLDRADTLAMYKIAQDRTWGYGDSEKYIFSNNDLITRYGGSTQMAVAQARSQYLKQGFFEQRSLNNDDMYNTYVATYPSVVFDSGATFLDQQSLANYYVTSGYQQGQIVPMTAPA